MKRNIRDILAGDVPDDVCEWVVEYHIEFDNRDLTPLLAVQLAGASMHSQQGHLWRVRHIRSGLQWSVDPGRNEVIEIEELSK